MDYEKKYKEALERARQFSEHPLQEDSDSIVEYIFPELAESEDERIREDIISLVNEFWERIGSINPEYSSRSRMLAWLEKQGEQKPNPVLDIEIPFGAKDSELQEATYHIPKGFHAEIDDDKVVIKQGEQKPAWSEEDMALLDSAIAFVEHSPFTTIGKGKGGVVDWLKSLKERYTWKPSDEQMEALWEAYKGGEEQAALASLYQDLKKLKG